MKRRFLGQSEIQVSPIALGGNVFGWTADEKTSFEILDRFYEYGFNFIDTADVYSMWVPGNSGGESESIIGKWMKSRNCRGRVVVATKVGMQMTSEKKGLSKKYIFEAVESSLLRLQTDYIDLYQTHRDDKTIPLTETLEALTDLKNSGKVRCIGASNYSPERLNEALQTSTRNGLEKFQTLQPLYNLYDRSEYESGLESICVANNLSVINYYSLASGFLTGKYRTKEDLSLKSKARGSRVQNYLNERGLKIVSALEMVSKELGTNPTQVAIAWLLSQPSITAPIASATNLTQLDDIISSATLELTSSQVKFLNEQSSY